MVEPRYYDDENEGDGEIAGCGGYNFSISREGKVRYALIGKDIISRENFSGVLETRAKELENVWKNRRLVKKN